MSTALAYHKDGDASEIVYPTNLKQKDHLKLGVRGQRKSCTVELPRLSELSPPGNTHHIMVGLSPWLQMPPA